MVIQFLSSKLNKSRLIWGLAAMVISFAALSCSKDNEPTPEDETALQQEIGSIAGLGNEPGTPQGAPFKLPEGVIVDGTITGDYCEEAAVFIGSGNFVTLCVGLRNDNDHEITVTFPGGLIFVSETDEYQNGLVVEEAKIVLPSKKTTRFIFHTYCGNSSRSPSSSSSVYTFGPVSNSKLIAKLISDLGSKKIAASEYGDGDDFSDAYYEVLSALQGLVWQITDGSKTTDWETFEYVYKDYLNQLPNK